jgi:flagellar hook assembly protein FlgD
MMIKLLLLAIWIVLNPVNAYSIEDEKPLAISNIHLDSKTFLPDKSETVTIGYTLSKAATVTLRIYSRNNLCVRILCADQNLAAGLNSIAWNGRDGNDRIVASGAYFYTIEAIGAGGRKYIYDRTDDTGGMLLKVRKGSIDVEKRQVVYFMPKAGRVRIRAGIKKGPLLNTIVDWEPRQAGQHVENWDGKDNAGLIDLFKINSREVYVVAYSLPDNSIIVKRKIPSVSETLELTTVLQKSDTDKIRRPEKQNDSIQIYKHARHDEAICHEPQFKVLFPQASFDPDENIPVLKGTTPVKIIIAEKDRRHLESERFEVMFFIDTVFLFEDEEGFTPFTYMWNTAGLPEGEHIVTVNIMSYDDHCGVVSKKVIIRR